MSAFQRIFRVYMLITALFIGGTSALVSGVVYLHGREFRDEARKAQRQLLETRLFGAYTQLAEEVYLKLDTQRLRTEQLQAAISERGQVQLSVERAAPDPTRRPSGPPRGSWGPDPEGDERLIAPLFFGDTYLGELTLAVTWSTGGGSSLVYYLGSVVGLMVGAASLVLVGLRRKVYTPLLGSVLHLQRTAAIAQTTQMLAHDIRRPFSLLKMAIEVLSRARSPSQVQDIMARLVPELTKAMLSVEGMIEDIMEIGSEAEPKPAPVAPESLIDAAILEVVSLRQTEGVTFTYRLAHKHQLDVDGLKVARVVTNILDNAVQAMGGKGEVWFETSEQAGRIEIAIGNTGSEIPAELHEKVFEAFFTRGKRNGTGLGLAIAHKIVTAHGGRIWVRTPRPGTAELRFILPAALQHKAETTTLLPATSAAVKRALSELREQCSEEMTGAGPMEERLEALIASRFTGTEALSVLLIDDESFYRRSVRSHLEHPASLAAAVSVHDAASSDEAFAVVERAAPRVVICDIDMGAGSLDGFQIVETLRERLPQTYICMHSNRMFAQDYQRAMQAGADAFLLKPMSRVHLLKILATTLLGHAAKADSAELKRLLEGKAS